MEFDDVFEHVGGFGPYQICLYLMTGLTVFYAGWQHMGMAILGAKVDHWCMVEELDDLPYADQKRIAIPYDTGEEEYSQCSAYVDDYGNYTPEELCYDEDFANMTRDTYECSAWEYNRTEFVDSPVSQFDLVCGDDYKVALSSTFYLFGVLVGSVLSGILSDKLGRYPVLIAGTIGHILFSVLAAFAPDYWSFTLMRFVVGAMAHGTYICGFVILMESTGPKYRSISGVLFPMNFSYGYMVLPMMAYFVRESTALLLCMAMPICSSLCFIFMIPESPRWLVTRGKFKEARRIVQFMAEVNGNTMPEKYEFTQDKKSDIEFLHLFRYPVLRRELIFMYICWFSNSLLYYGIGLNAGAVSGNIFLNVFIGAIVEIPGQIVGIFIIYYIGRRITFAYCFLIAALANFIAMFIINNEDLVVVLMVMVALTKACIKVTFTVGYIYTAELFPTPVRHLAVGSSSMMSRLGGILAPFVGGPLLEIWAPLPPLIFGLSSLLSGVLALFLPETRGKELPDTIEQAILLADKNYHPGVEIDIDADKSSSNPVKIIGETEKAGPNTDTDQSANTGTGITDKHRLHYSEASGIFPNGLYKVSNDSDKSTKESKHRSGNSYVAYIDDDLPPMEPLDIHEYENSVFEDIDITEL